MGYLIDNTIDQYKQFHQDSPTAILNSDLINTLPRERAILMVRNWPFWGCI